MKLPLPPWLVNRIIARAQRTPYIHLDGYMNRWWLLPYNRTGYAARVHEIVSSDRERDLHNHPWPYITVILRGGYFEHTPGGRWDVATNRRWYGPGSVLVRPANSFHRLELWRRPDGTEESCWTLFLTGRKRRDTDPGHSCWGFMVGDVFVPADVYLGSAYISTDYSGSSRGQVAG